MYIAILGRQPSLGMAELEHLYGSKAVSWFSHSSALIQTNSFSIDHIGGTIKAGRVITELPVSDWRTISTKIIQHYTKKWAEADAKITLGVSVYDLSISPREVQKVGILLKQKLKAKNVSLRLIPNQEISLNSAVSHHNKLGLSANKVELLIVKATGNRVVIAESIGAQNITKLARRDQGRPKRDAFVGMLPPKLAQIMVNFTREEQTIPQKHRLLDPFCGTGVVLQEAALMGYDVYGTDLSEKMIDYSQTNLEWLARTHHVQFDLTLHQGDATTSTWEPPINSVVCESYLGQPFSAPPSPEKLASVVKNCDHIIGSFLKNIAGQLKPGTPLCMAVPAWRDRNGHFTRLPLTYKTEALGYELFPFTKVHLNDLLYYREDQVVARQLLVLVKA